jgi:elongation factor Ts
MEITASLVKDLRERTGAGMMECKKALTEHNGDIDAAAEALRKSGLAKADKKASRVAAEGRIAAAQDGGKAVLIEINSETDFVAKDENFRVFADAVADAVLAAAPSDVPELMQAQSGGRSLEEARQALVAKIGENVAVRRFELLDSSGNVGVYVHMDRIGVLVELEGGDEALAKDLAMQVAATSPRHVAP